MSTTEKLYFSIISGLQDKNIKFKDLQKLLHILGFECRVRGDHFIYSYGTLRENINIQPSGNMAKPYQELPGCMADGKTIEEAIANTEVIIKEWIEVTLERGLEVPEPKGRLMYA